MFRVYIDGVSVGNVDIISAQTVYRRQAYSKNFSSSAQHTIRIYVLSGRIDVDAFAVLK